MVAQSTDPKSDQPSKDVEPSSSKDAKTKKDDKKNSDEEELSEEDEKLKNELEMLVERLKVGLIFTIKETIANHHRNQIQNFTLLRWSLLRTLFAHPRRP